MWNNLPKILMKPRTIDFSYAGVLISEPMDNLINAIEPGRVELNVDSFWFPIDGRFSKQLSADVSIHIGEGWLGLMAVREYLGVAAYDEMLEAFAAQIADKDLPHIWKKGDTDRGDDRIAYRKAPLALAQLEDVLGG